MEREPEAEIIVIDDDVDEIKCDGGGGPLGHPKVWYALENVAECAYCDRVFVKEKALPQLKGKGSRTY